MKWTILFVVVAIAVTWGIILNLPEKEAVVDIPVTSFEECLRAGNTVMESYPRQCRTPKGGHFVEDIGNELEKKDLIRITSPRPNQVITNPLIITGEARGYWFFEATFPVFLTDWDGRIISQHYAEAESEWMVTDFVPFRAVLEFETPPFGERGTLILAKSNASGLPEHDDAVEIPILFEMEDIEGKRDGGAYDSCIITGCSGQICSDENVITTCEFRPEYACYQGAVCEKQKGGECGWTRSKFVDQCLTDLNI